MHFLLAAGAALQQATVSMPDGAGPRHIAVHPDGRRYYVAIELSSNISLVEGLGTPTHTVTATVSTLPADAQGTDNYPSHIALGPDARRLYLANRVHQSIAVFDVDASSGRLSPKQHGAVRGDWPRHFAIGPDGGALVVANQRSGNVAVFDRQADTGELAFRRSLAAPVPAPMFILFE